jgi:hypothetical protein
MNYNELYDILKENFEKEGDFKVIKDLNLTIETIPFQSKKADLLNGSFCETSCEKHHANFKENNENMHFMVFLRLIQKTLISKETNILIIIF